MRLVARLQEALPPGRRLIEPFVGSGAVFLNTGSLLPVQATLINFQRVLGLVDAQTAVALGGSILGLSPAGHAQELCGHSAQLQLLPREP